MGDEAQQRRKQGPEVLPRESADVCLMAASRDVYHPPSPTSGSRLSPKTRAMYQLSAISRASGRKLHSIIKGVFVALILCMYDVSVRVCLCLLLSP